MINFREIIKLKDIFLPFSLIEQLSTRLKYICRFKFIVDMFHCKSLKFNPFSEDFVYKNAFTILFLPKECNISTNRH